MNGKSGLSLVGGDASASGASLRTCGWEGLSIDGNQRNKNVAMLGYILID